MMGRFDKYADEPTPSAPTTGRFDKYADEVAQPAASVSQPEPPKVKVIPVSREVVPPGLLPAYDGSVPTTATVPPKPAEARAIAKQVGLEQLRGEQTNSRGVAAAFGAARGLTLGAVDRAVGLGSALGEKAAEFAPYTGGQTAPADPNAYAKARAEYLAAEDVQKKDFPAWHFGGEVVGATGPSIALSPLGRFGAAATQGGAAGALNTRSDNPVDMAKGGALGAVGGLAIEGTLGTGLRRLIGGAPKRKEDAVIRDVMESEAGRANLRTAGFQIAKDIDDVRSVLKEYPEVAKASAMPAEKALPVVRKHIALANKGQDARYALVEKELEKSGQEMTVEGLLRKIESAKHDSRIPAADRSNVQDILNDMKSEIVKVHAPEWALHGGGRAVQKPSRGPLGEPTTTSEHVVSTKDLREWVTAAQDRASMTMGKLNGTATYKVPERAARLANDILEEQLDKAWTVGMRSRDVGGVMKAVDAIRESDRKVSALLAVSAAIKDRGQKEALQAVGLGGRLAAEHRKQELAAAAGLASTGHPGAAAALVLADPTRRGLAAASRSINDRALAPLEEAAASGNLKSQLAKQAIERGLPQGASAATIEALRKQGTYYPPALQQPTPTTQGTPQSDWRASTAIR